MGHWNASLDNGTSAISNLEAHNAIFCVALAPQVVVVSTKKTHSEAHLDSSPRDINLDCLILQVVYLNGSVLKRPVFELVLGHLSPVKETALLLRVAHTKHFQ